MVISSGILLRMRNISNKSCGENINTHIMINNFFPINSSVLKDNTKNMVMPYKPQMIIIRRMRFACRITGHTHTECAFPRQQWLQYTARLALEYDAAPVGGRIPIILGKSSNLNFHDNASWAPQTLKTRGTHAHPWSSESTCLSTSVLILPVNFAKEVATPVSTNKNWMTYI